MNTSIPVVSRSSQRPGESINTHPLRRVARLAVATALLAVAVPAALAADPALTVLDNLQLWLKADTGVTATGAGAVTEWADQSGQNNHALQTDEAMAPLLVPNALNTKPVLRFDGTDDYLDVAYSESLAIAGDLASFAVLRVDDFATWRGIWGKTVSNLPGPTDYYLVSGTGVPRVYRGDGTSTSLGNVDANRAIRAGTYLILAFDMAGTTLTHYLNGFPIGSGEITAVLADGGGPLKIGTREDFVTRLKGDLAELLIYNVALSSTDRDKVFDYLKNKYGILNIAPSVQITAPANNATFTPPATTTVKVSATDSDGTIARVDFLANGRVIATATAPPFEVPLSLDSGGDITLTARAVDDKDAEATSAAVAIKVNPGTAPTYTPGSSLKLWLKADAGVTTGTGDAVTGWADQSGNNNHAAQADEGLAPVLVPNAVNNQPALHFDGVDDYLDVAHAESLAITGDIASFFVVRYEDFASWRAVWAKTSGNLPRPTDYYAQPGAGVPLVYRGNSSAWAAVGAAGGSPAGQFLLGGFSQAGTVLTHWLNGSAYGSGTLTVAPSDDGNLLKIGTRDDFVTKMKGEIAELLIYDAALSAAEQDNLTRYLAGKFNIPLFKNANLAPTVSITSPADGVTLAAPANLTLTAQADDTDGGVVSVAFYANGLLIDRVTKAPFELPVRVFTPGALTFTAIATDNLGATTTSAPVAGTATGSTPVMFVTTGLQLWLKADAGVTTAAGGAVTAWADQSGQANDALQADESFAPVLADNVVNGKPTIRFDGTSEYLDISNAPELTLLGDLASFFVARFDDFAGFRAVWSQTVGNWPYPNDYYVTAGGGIPTFNRGGANGLIGGLPGLRAVPAGAFAVLGFDSASRLTTHYFNGAANGSAQFNFDPEDGGSPVRIGSRDNLETQMKGDLAELLVYNRALSESERNTVVQHLASKYGIPIVRVAPVVVAPTLSIHRPSTTTVTISWPAGTTGFVLESSTVLPAATWTEVPNVANNSVTVSSTAGAQYFRLRQP